jgi:hypothetical protein
VSVRRSRVQPVLPIVFAAAAALVPLPAAAADVLEVRLAEGAKVLKSHRATHELRIDEVSFGIDGNPPVADGTGGWVSASQDIVVVDECLRAAAGGGRALEFRRTIREAGSKAKVNVVRRGMPPASESTQSISPLVRQNVRFTWVDAERDWSRRFEKVDAEEEWLEPLRGEFELACLLPAGETKAGDTWKVDLAAFRDVLAPGGNLQLTPTAGGLFGRTNELGVAGDFADFYADPVGAIDATYKGTREIEVPEGDATAKRTVAVIELQIQVACTADRTQLYRMAMPDNERRENARVDGASLELTLFGTGELLWDTAAGRFHSFAMRAQESFTVSVRKTRFDGRDQHPIVALSRYSGPMTLDIACKDASGLAAEKELDNPKLKGGGRRSRK